MFEKYMDTLTLEEASEALNKDRRTVVKLLKNGELDYRIVRNRYRISKKSIIDYVNISCYEGHRYAFEIHQYT